MPGKHLLRKAYDNLDLQKADDVVPIPGILGFMINGRPIVQVPNRPGYVYVRFRDNLSEVCQAYNDSVSPVYNLPVLITRDKTDRSRYRITGRDLGRYENWSTSTPYLPLHGSQHSFNPPYEGGDVVWVYQPQFMPLLGYPSGTTGGDRLFIRPYTYYDNGTWRRFNEQYSPSFLSYKPTSISGSKLALLYLAHDGTPNIVAGASEFFYTGSSISQIISYLPPIPTGSAIPIAAVRLESGTSTITWDNLYDVRQFVNFGSERGVGGSETLVDYSNLSTVSGWSSITTKQIFYMRFGQMVFVRFQIVGTSNATTASLTLPFPASISIFNVGPIRAMDNGVWKSSPGIWVLNVGTTQLNLWPDYTPSNWTASGDKRVQGGLWYWAQP